MSEKAKNPIKWKGKFWWLPTLKSMLKEDDGTPAKIVTSVNGQTGDVTVETTPGDVVTSFNGKTGAVTGVDSVNGQTGAVTITGGVESVNGHTGAVTISEVKQAHATSITFDVEGPEFYFPGTVLTEVGITKDDFAKRIVAMIGVTSYGSTRLCYPQQFNGDSSLFFFNTIVQDWEGNINSIEFTDVYVYYI